MCYTELQRYTTNQHTHFHTTNSLTHTDTLCDIPCVCVSGVEDILVKEGANRQRKRIIQESLKCGTKVTPGDRARTNIPRQGSPSGQCCRSLSLTWWLLLFPGPAGDVQSGGGGGGGGGAGTLAGRPPQPRPERLQHGRPQVQGGGQSGQQRHQQGLWQVGGSERSCVKHVCFLDGDATRLVDKSCS